MLVDKFCAGEEVYGDNILEFVQLFDRPLFSFHAFAELHNKDAILDCFVTLGRIITLGIPEMTQNVCEAISAFASYDAVHDPATNPSEKNLHFDILKDSGILLLVCDFLTDVLNEGAYDGSIDDLSVAVGALREVSFNKGCSSELVNFGVLETLPLLLENPRRDILIAVTELVWNAIDHVPDSIIRLSGEDTVQTLHIVLCDLLSNGNKTEDKEIRNDILLILDHISRSEESHLSFARTGK